MARKSNKTSHVLHLLAGEEPVPEEEKKETSHTEAKSEPQDAEQKKETPQDAPSPEISIVTAGSSTADPLSDLIREQLEETLEEQTAAASNMETAEAPQESLPAKEESGDSPMEQAADVPDTRDTNTGSDKNTDNGSMPDSNENAANGTTADATLGIDQNTAADDSLNMDQNTGANDTSNTEQSTAADDVPNTEQDTAADDVSNTEQSTAADDVPNTEQDTGTASETDEILPHENPVLSPDHLNALLYPNDDEDSIHYRFINVMEYVVKDMVIDYMKKFGMCTCERCVVDTTALTLTLCSAKYIVVDKHTISPLLNFYSSKFTGEVTVALTRACTMVNQNPRH